MRFWFSINFIFKILSPTCSRGLIVMTAPFAANKYANNTNGSICGSGRGHGAGRS